MEAREATGTQSRTARADFQETADPALIEAVDQGAEIKLLSYEELYQVVKSGRNRDNIRKHVSTIRDALREIDPAFEGIENIPMRGFRWAGRRA